MNEEDIVIQFPITIFDTQPPNWTVGMPMGLYLIRDQATVYSFTDDGILGGSIYVGNTRLGLKIVNMEKPALPTSDIPGKVSFMPGRETMISIDDFIRLVAVMKGTAQLEPIKVL